jgi:transcriptional regulator with XRE-family HTH domain
MQDGRMTDTPNTLDLAIGVHIKARRKTLKVSQAALADAVGVSFQQVQKYERGSNRVSFSRLVGIAHALDCRVIDLIGDLDEWVPTPSFRQDTAHIRVDGAAEVIAAYAELPTAMRKAVLSLVKEIAKANRHPDR